MSSISRLSKKCAECPFVEKCNGKKMEAIAYIDQTLRETVVTNYYQASNSLISIGTIKDIPYDLRELAINASIATTKIIDYVNAHREL